MLNRKIIEYGTIPAEWDFLPLIILQEHKPYSMAMGPFGSNIKRENFIEAGVPVIRGSNLNTSKYVNGDFVYLSDEKADELLGSNCIAKDLVFTHRGTIGQVALIPENEYPRYVISQSGMKFSPDTQKVNPQFLLYFFKSKYGQYQIKKYESQVGVPSISNPLTSLKEIQAPIPPLPEQKAIAGVLTSLDDKIDLLHRQNETLEALAQTFFRQWFIEEAQDDWEEGVLPDEFDFTMGLSPPGTSYNENRIGTPMYQGNADFQFRFPKNRVFTNDPRRMAKKFDTLISVRAPVGEQNMANENCCIGRGVASFRYKTDPSYFSYTYYKIASLMKQIKVFDDTGTVFGSINKGDFQALAIVVPPLELVEKFQGKVHSIDEKIFLNHNQINTLENLRDTLLPKLMSGEVRVKL